MSKTSQPGTDNQQGKVSDTVDEYMRMAGRMLYEIILDWQKRKVGQSQSGQLDTNLLERRSS